MAETNYPKASNGIFVLATPVLGGTYLANYVLTTNLSAPVAKLRREWFITYVSSDKAVVPATTACADVLDATQLATYTQVGLSICWTGVLLQIAAAGVLLRCSLTCSSSNGYWHC